jgi:hypothetical protein
MRIDPLFPEMDPSSAVYPTVRIVGDSLHLAYHLPGCDDSAVVTFHGVKAWRYGPPNDEGLATHPLWGQGLTFYNFHELVLGRDEQVHRWIATFHDGTLEISAIGQPSVRSAKVEGATPSSALDRVLGPGRNDVLDEHA